MWPMLTFLIGVVALAIAIYSVWRVTKIEKQSHVATGLAGDKSDQLAQLRASIHSVDTRLNTFMEYLTMQADGPALEAEHGPTDASPGPFGGLQCDGDICHIPSQASMPTVIITSTSQDAAASENTMSMANQMLGHLVNMMTVPDAVVSSAETRVEEIADDTDSEETLPEQSDK